QRRKPASERQATALRLSGREPEPSVADSLLLTIATMPEAIAGTEPIGRSVRRPLPPRLPRKIRPTCRAGPYPARPYRDFRHNFRLADDTPGTPKTTKSLDPVYSLTPSTLSRLQFANGSGVDACRSEMWAWEGLMRTNHVRIIALVPALLILLLDAGGQALAQAAKAAHPAMAPIDQYLISNEQSEIALARGAAPSSISDGA